MRPPKVTKLVKEGIIARIQAGRSTAADEARKYGLKPATVRGWIHEAKEKGMSAPPQGNEPTTPTPTQPVTTPNDAPVGKPPDPGANPTADPAAIARARAAAGLPPLGNSTPPPTNPAAEAALQAADAEDKRLVTETYKDAKKAAVELLARRVGLDTADPLLASASEVSPIVNTVLSTNAGLIAPTIRGRLVGWPAVAGVLIFDAAVMMMAIREVAVARGKIKEKQEQPPPRQPFTVDRGGQREGP